LAQAPIRDRTPLRSLSIICAAAMRSLALLALSRGAVALSGAIHQKAIGAAVEASRAAEHAPLSGCAGFDCVERYVNSPDAAYSWREESDQLLSGSLNGVAWKGYVLTMVSQRWLGETDTDRQVWSHPMVVVVPENLDSSAEKVKEWATLVVGGAHSSYLDYEDGVTAKDKDMQAAIYMAVQTGSVAAVVLQVPNQPIVFKADPLRAVRIEDQIKAKTWRHFENETTSPEWLLELPNAKATVRAMDTVGSFSENLGLAVRRFGVMGCSKRANAALMACAHDSRCELVMPCSMTANTKVLYEQIMRSFGEPVAALFDYWKESVFANLDSPEFDQLVAIVDSGSYMEKLTMPKLWLNAVSDDFFAPDHTHAFWSNVPSPKYMFQRENAVHAGTLDTSNFLAPAAAFTSFLLLDRPLPELSWSIDPSTGTLSIRQSVGDAPLSITVWSAKTCSASPRRDFRAVTIDRGKECKLCGVLQGAMCNVSSSTRWTKREQLNVTARAWDVSVPIPTKGWEAFFVTFDFGPARPEGEPLQLSSEVVVVPLDKYPYPDCRSPASAARGGCKGNRLVLAQSPHNATGDM